MGVAGAKGFGASRRDHEVGLLGEPFESPLSQKTVFKNYKKVAFRNFSSTVIDWNSEPYYTPT